VQGAEDVDALQIGTRQRRDEGTRSRGEDEQVVWLDHLAASADDEPLIAVDVFDLDARMDEDAALLEPLRGPQRQLFRRVEAVENAGKQDPAIEAGWVAAEHANLEAVRRPADDLFGELSAGHAGPDDDERGASD